MAKFRRNPFHSRENSPMHAHDFSQGNCGMRPQDASAGQALADSRDFGGAYGIARAVSEQAQNPWCAHDRNSGLAREANKDVPREKRALKVDYTVGPFGTHRVQRQVVFKGTHRQVLSNPPFMVRNDMHYTPSALGHFMLR